MRGTASSFSWVIAFFMIVQFVVMWGYYVLFEGLRDGQTPGKRVMRLRVVRDGGYSVTFGASAVRNLVRIIDMQPGILYLVGIITTMFTRSGKRLGDLIAGTMVIKEGVVTVPRATNAGRTTSASDTDIPDTRGRIPAPAASLTTVLSDDEYTLLERFMARRLELAPDRRSVLVQQLATRLAAHLSTAPDSNGRSETDARMLVRLFERERDARATGTASRSDTGARREQHALVAIGLRRWNDFATALAEARRRGLRRMSAEEVSTLVAQYRELTTDLARLQTATRGRESDAVFYVSRLVAGGHNLLYRQRSTTSATVTQYLLHTVPREVRRSWRPIVVAAALMFGPATVAYVAVVQHPAVAATFLPDEMLSRARNGSAREHRGEGYVTIEEDVRPIAASQIMTNNVQVAYLTFALGVTAGIGTIALLVFNGVSFGGVLGLFAAEHVAHLLLAFVLPHGVLELTAICIAAGGGLLLASAILLPGAMTRRAALILRGRRAIDLIAAATVLLIVAGTIEGLISPRRLADGVEGGGVVRDTRGVGGVLIVRPSYQGCRPKK